MADKVPGVARDQGRRPARRCGYRVDRCLSEGEVTGQWSTVNYKTRHRPP
jgi:hypothetical protein